MVSAVLPYSKLNLYPNALLDYDKFLAAKPTDQVALERRAEANRHENKLPEAVPITPRQSRGIRKSGPFIRGAPMPIT